MIGHRERVDKLAGPAPSLVNQWRGRLPVFPEESPPLALGLDETPPTRATTHIDKDTFKQIFRDHWEEFRGANPRYASPYDAGVIDKMLKCGDPQEMGFAQYRCFRCGETRRIAFSCKSCFCLSCAKVYADQWVEFIRRRRFPGVVSRHIVLTVPDYLRLWFYRQPRRLARFIGRMVQHLLPKGFQRIRYYGLHSHRRYDAVRRTLAGPRHALARPDPRGYRVVPRTPFPQRFVETFRHDPFRCPACGETMQLWVIYHPAYGTLHDCLASATEFPHDPTARASPDRLRGPVDRPEHLVSVPLPGM